MKAIIAITSYVSRIKGLRPRFPVANSKESLVTILGKVKLPQTQCWDAKAVPLPENVEGLNIESAPN